MHRRDLNLWRRWQLLALVGSAAVVALVGAAQASAAVLTVCASRCGYTTIAAALAAPASAGGTILIGPGTYTGVAISENVNLVGLGDPTINDNYGYGTIITIGPGVVATISGVTITQGGAGILNDGTLTLNNTTVTDNAGMVDGGGIDNRGTLTLNRSTISDNSAGQGASGGIDNHGGTVTLNLSTVIHNYCGLCNGGGIENTDGNVTLRASSVTDNNANGETGLENAYGGGIYNSGTLTLYFSAVLATRSLAAAAPPVPEAAVGSTTPVAQHGRSRASSRTTHPTTR